MSAATPDAIPLYPRRRLVGTTSGGATSIRRGGRADAASSRPYRPGDHFSAIDWKASARLSSARNGDEFIVRERHAEETPAVALVVDRRPGMALYPEELPWLHKPDALRVVAQLLIRSALNQRALLAYLDLATHPGETAAGTAFWRAPRPEASSWHPGLREGLEGWLAEPFDAPDDNLELALDFLATRRSAVPLGSFVFVLSDFVVPPAGEVWAHVIARGWDVVPVIVQDPVWEQSFPDIDGVLISLADADAEAGRGAPRRVRLGRAQVRERRAANERRLALLRSGLIRLGLEPVLVGSADPAEVQAVFLDWAQARLELGRAG